MTRLTNYVGQKVLIANRNIAAAGNFIKGIQPAYLDISVNSSETAGKARAVLEKASEESGKQVSGIILSWPKVLKTLYLQTGERFAWLHTGIRPQQQWIAEQ